MFSRRLLALVAVVALVSALAASRRARQAPACLETARLTYEPATPVKGKLFRIRVDSVPTGVVLSGEVARERLHFTRDTLAFTHALAAIPIDGADSIPLTVRCELDGTIDSAVVVIATHDGEYAIERLRVAPAFGRPPDSATAARIQRESRRASAVAVAAHDTPRLWGERFIVPRTSRITSAFGSGREFNGTITSRHMGTDFAGAVGAPVRAPNRGVVRIVDSFFYGGNVVYVDHGAGLSSAFLHLSESLVAVGDTVERGQTLGRVGATGRVTGPHLHFIVRYGSVTVDPVSLFAIVGEPTPDSTTTR